MNLEITKNLLKKLDHFYFKLNAQYDETTKTIKKDIMTPKNWQQSKKDDPISIKGYNAVGIILGQQYEKNKYLVGVDIDNKPEETTKDCIKLNGVNYFGELCEKNNYQPNETLSEETRSNGLHFYYYVDSKTLKLLGKNKTDIYTDYNKKCSIDFKTSGRNGKGLLDLLIRCTFGSYYSTIDISYFTTMTKKSNEASPEMADKNGVRLLISTEPESTETIKVKTVKKTTGGDIINARKLYQNDFSFTPQFKLFIQTNEIPNLSKLDRAIEERITIIPFPNTFVNVPKRPNERQIDINLKNKLANLEFRQEFINYLFEIYNKYGSKDLKTKLHKPKLVMISTNNYLKENDPIKPFLDEYYIITDNMKLKIKNRDLYDEFMEFSEETMSPKKFYSLIRYNNVTEKFLSGVPHFYGLEKKKK